MTNRNILIEYVKNGGEKFLCSPQIGAGAGFDTKLAGKTWITETTLEDTIRACKKFDMVPLYNFGVPDLAEKARGITSKGNSSIEGNRRIYSGRLITSKGELSSRTIEEELKGCVPVQYYISQEEELEILEYYIDSILEAGDYSHITAHVERLRQAIGEQEAMDIQWAMQPYELLGFPDTMNTAILATICEPEFRRLMDKILRLDEKIIEAVAKGGADFVFLGGPGSEMISPRYYEEFLVPYSKIVTQMAHDKNLLVYTHICSPVEPMLSLGYYNQMGIDLFETLSEAPVGNVLSLEDAFSKLDESICTRGNIGLDKLLQEKPQDIRRYSLEILETARRMGRKHILAASDYLFYAIPEENVTAMCEAVQEFNAKH